VEAKSKQREKRDGEKDVFREEAIEREKQAERARGRNVQNESDSERIRKQEREG
jgi:hypothetical protein